MKLEVRRLGSCLSTWYLPLGRASGLRSHGPPICPKSSKVDINKTTANPLAQIVHRSRVSEFARQVVSKRGSTRVARVPESCCAKEDCQDPEGGDPSAADQSYHTSAHRQLACSKSGANSPRDCSHNFRCRYPHHCLREHQSCEEGCVGQMLRRRYLSQPSFSSV